MKLRFLLRPSETSAFADRAAAKLAHCRLSTAGHQGIHVYAANTPYFGPIDYTVIHHITVARNRHDDGHTRH